MAVPPQASSMRGTGRGPLWAIILARTGEDVRQCIHCWRCEAEQRPDMDMSYGEVLQAAARDSRRALENQTIWFGASPRPGEVQCPSGLDVAGIFQILQEEALRRGLRPPSTHTMD